MALNPQNIEKYKFRKGVSGNPKGRPKGIPNAATRYQRLLSIVSKAPNPITNHIEEFTQVELMDMRIMAKALKGDLAAYKEIMDRLEGRTIETVKMNSTANTKVIIHDEARNEASFNKQE